MIRWRAVWGDESRGVCVWMLVKRRPWPVVGKVTNLHCIMTRLFSRWALGGGVCALKEGKMAVNMRPSS